MKELRPRKHKAMQFKLQVIALALCYPAREFATKLGVIAVSLCGYPLRLGIYAILAVAQRALSQTWITWGLFILPSDYDVVLYHYGSACSKCISSAQEVPEDGTRSDSFLKGLANHPARKFWDHLPRDYHGTPCLIGSVSQHTERLKVPDWHSYGPLGYLAGESGKRNKQAF